MSRHLILFLTSAVDADDITDTKQEVEILGEGGREMVFWGRLGWLRFGGILQK